MDCSTCSLQSVRPTGHRIGLSPLLESWELSLLLIRPFSGEPDDDVSNLHSVDSEMKRSCERRLNGLPQI
jgi:hypothetical protein